MRNNWVYRWAFLFAACGVPTIRAEISFTLDKLDASDGLPLPPPNIVIVDLRVDVSPGDAWSGTGLEGRSFAGAEIEYAYDELGYPLGTAPGVDNRFVTFLSRPRARNNDARFGVGAAVTLLSYSYEVILLYPTFINAAGFPNSNEPDRDGYVLRLALDLSNVSDPAFRTDSDNIVLALSPPPNALRLFETSSWGQFGLGAAVASAWGFYHEFGFGVYGIPEPATSVAFLAALVVMARRRSLFSH